jgi:hypothetical protein
MGELKWIAQLIESDRDVDTLKKLMVKIEKYNFF